MVTENMEFYGKALKTVAAMGLTRAVQRIQAIGHRWKYEPTASPKNIVIIGGSYGGTHLAQRLTETLPTGYRAVLIERNSHFNHFFVFPRFGIIPGREHKAFVPYDGMAKTAPKGIFQHIRDSATEITPDTVRLASGEEVKYEYLALATGAWQPAPSKFESTEKRDGCLEFQAAQDRVRDARRIAVVGGGPVGVQIATDIKSFFPAKDVTLIHSRTQLLSKFGPRLQETVVEALDRLRVNLVLGERPRLGMGQTTEKKERKETLTFKNGNQVLYDLVIPCTGQRPNSTLLSHLAPAAICPQTRQILVHPTLQIADGTSKYPRVFALGDVAKTGGPRFARAARVQADVVQSNILAMINQEEMTSYRPAYYENFIKLTLGKTNLVLYGRDEDGKEMMLKGTTKDDDLNVGEAWSNLGAKLPS